MAVGHIRPAACFCTAREPRVVFTWQRVVQANKEEYVTETTCGPGSLSVLCLTLCGTSVWTRWRLCTWQLSGLGSEGAALGGRGRVLP